MHRVFFVKHKEKNISKPITPKRINLLFKWKKIKRKEKEEMVGSLCSHDLSEKLVKEANLCM